MVTATTLQIGSLGVWLLMEAEGETIIANEELEFREILDSDWPDGLVTAFQLQEALQFIQFKVGAQFGLGIEVVGVYRPDRREAEAGDYRLEVIVRYVEPKPAEEILVYNLDIIQTEGGRSNVAILDPMTGSRQTVENAVAPSWRAVLTGHLLEDALKVLCSRGVRVTAVLPLKPSSLQSRQIIGIK